MQLPKRKFVKFKKNTEAFIDNPISRIKFNNHYSGFGKNPVQSGTRTQLCGCAQSRRDTPCKTGGN